jgi:hypothetical protein
MVLMAQNRMGRAWDDVQPYYSNGQGSDAAAYAAYGTTGFLWLKFDDDAAKDKEWQFGFQLPHRWAFATSIHFHLHVVPSANGAAGNEDVVFQISYQWVNIDGSYSTTTNTDLPATFRVGAADANKHKYWEFSAISGAGKTLSSDLVIILRRMSKTSAADNYTGDIWLRYTDLHVEIDKIGSISELL